MIIILASVFAVLLVVYFAVIAPLMREGDDEKTPVELIEGEALDTDGETVMMFPLAESSSMQSVEVHNQYGTFSVYRNENSDFYIKDHEQAPFSVTSLAVSAGYTSTLRRLTVECENWENYGLGADDEPAWYVLTLLDGTQHKVYIGDMIPSGGGYYARYDGRDALYVLNSSISSTLLVPVENLVTPYLGYETGTDYAEIERFFLLKNGESFIYIDYDRSIRNETTGTLTSIYDMVYPAYGYSVADQFSEEVLQTLSTLKGYATIKLGSALEPLYKDAELMAQYGFEDVDRAPYELYYKFDGMESIILFAPSGVEGYYFAYSYLFNLIALIETDTVPYLEWSIMDFMQSGVFRESINDVAEIEVSGLVNRESGDLPAEGESSEYKYISESFRLSGEGSALKVTPASTNKVLSYDQLQNFRNFYIVLLQLNVKGYMRGTGVEDLSALEEFARFKITMDDGEVKEYVFYSYSAQRWYITVNGKGEFWVNSKDVQKVLTDATRAARGETVEKSKEYSSYVGWL